MLLIGISGSTKCDWQLIDGDKKISAFNSSGLNPFFHNEQEIADIIKGQEELKHVFDQIEVVYVYSAGCASKSLQAIVHRALTVHFPKAHKYVNHDIVASALDTYEGSPSIACILGTGSNACYFDGDILRQEAPALDYILGDQGGGSYYGKRLLHDYLHGNLPSHLRSAFEEKYHTSQDAILENVYMKPYANVYLASHMKFIQEYKEESYCQELIREGMSRFMDLYITGFHQYKSVKTHFTGSIAYFFQDILNEVARSKEIQVGKIIKEPIEDLVAYHIKKMNKK